MNSLNLLKNGKSNYQTKRGAEDRELKKREEKWTG